MPKSPDIPHFSQLTCARSRGCKKRPNDSYTSGLTEHFDVPGIYKDYYKQQQYLNEIGNEIHKLHLNSK